MLVRSCLVRKQGHVLAASMIVALFCMFLVPSVAADGGAPNLAYVAGTSQGISTIDIGQEKVTGGIALKEDSRMVLLSIDGRVLYIAEPGAGRVVALAPAIKQSVCSAALPGSPSLLALDPSSNTVYAAGTGATRVSALDPMTCAVKQTFTASGNVYGLAIVQGESGAPNQLWVAAAGSLDIFTVGGKQLATVPVAEGPRYLCAPPGTTVYLTTQQGSVLAIDQHSRKLSTPLLNGGSFGPMDYDSQTGKIYLPDLSHNLLDVLAPVSNGTTVPRHEPEDVLYMPAAPQSVAITSDGQYGFVALTDGSVVSFDVNARQTIATFHVGGSPHFIITGLYPSALSPQQLSILSFLTHYGAVGIIVIVAAILMIREWVRMRKFKTSQQGK